jgi:hypothetical protein
MHKLAPWGNRLLFPPIIKDKRNEPPMNHRLSTLVKRVLDAKGPSIGSPLLFVCGAAHVKSIS